MKITIIAFFTIISSLSSAQIIKVNYERIKTVKYDGGVNKICPATLYLSQEKSIFSEDFLINGKNTQVPLEEFRAGKKLGRNIYGCLLYTSPSPRD